MVCGSEGIDECCCAETSKAHAINHALAKLMLIHSSVLGALCALCALCFGTTRQQHHRLMRDSLRFREPPCLRLSCLSTYTLPLLVHHRHHYKARTTLVVFAADGWPGECFVGAGDERPARVLRVKEARQGILLPCLACAAPIHRTILRHPPPLHPTPHSHGPTR